MNNITISDTDLVAALRRFFDGTGVADPAIVGRNRIPGRAATMAAGNLGRAGSMNRVSDLNTVVMTTVL